MAELGQYTIQRGLDERHYPDSYEEKGYETLGEARSRVHELHEKMRFATFRIVDEKSWNGRGWTKMWDKNGRQISD